MSFRGKVWDQLSDLHVLFGCPEDSVVTSLRVCSPPQEGSGCGEGFGTYSAHQKQKPVACNKKKRCFVGVRGRSSPFYRNDYACYFLLFSCHISCQTFRTNYQWLWIIYYHDSWNWYCIQKYIYIWFMRWIVMDMLQMLTYFMCKPLCTRSNTGKEIAVLRRIGSRSRGQNEMEFWEAAVQVTKYWTLLVGVRFFDAFFFNLRYGTLQYIHWAGTEKRGIFANLQLPHVSGCFVREGFCWGDVP